MKKTMMALIAASLFSALPAYAMDHEHTQATAAEMQCAKECDMLLKDCTREADSLQQRVKKLKTAIKSGGADQQKVENLRLLQAKLKEANDLIKSLSKPGH